MMNVVTQPWIIITVTIGCEKITNSRQHSKPIEFEELSRQLRQWSGGKEGNARFANDGTFAFSLRSFWDSLWMLESEVREWAFPFSSDCHEFHKRCLNMSQISNYGSTWPNKWLLQMLLSCRSMYSSAPPVPTKTQIFKVLSTPHGETKAENIYHCPNVCESCGQFICTNLFKN